MNRYNLEYPFNFKIVDCNRHLLYRATETPMGTVEARWKDNFGNSHVLGRFLKEEVDFNITHQIWIISA